MEELRGLTDIVASGGVHRPSITVLHPIELVDVSGVRDSQ